MHCNNLNNLFMTRLGSIKVIVNNICLYSKKFQLSPSAPKTKQKTPENNIHCKSIYTGECELMHSLVLAMTSDSDIKNKKIIIKKSQSYLFKKVD